MIGRTRATVAVLALLIGAGGAANAQAPATPPPAAAPAPQSYMVGNALGLPVRPAANGAFNATSANVKVFGSVYSAESCSYDPDRKLIVVPNRGVAQNVQTNNAWITLLNSDGSVHTSRWIGVQGAVDRPLMTPSLTLNEPYGSDIVKGVLYLADRDGGATPSDPILSVVRRFDMRTGAQLPDIRVAGAGWFNDIAVAADGTIYGSVSNDGQVWRVLPNGQASIFAQGPQFPRPNGVALDPAGNIVVVNVGDDAVLTYSPAGALLRTEKAVQAGSDGLVIMPDGTKYVSSVVNGGVSRIRPGRAAELIASNIPSAASMCYDAGARQLVIPMNDNNALAFIKID